MVLIPGGTFEMGVDPKDLKELEKMGRKVPHMNKDIAKAWFGDETPKHTVTVDTYYMDIYEVTNRQFKKFVKATGYKAKGNWKKYAKKKRMDHPVVNVTWHDARAYAKWAGKRLPTEAEWEYAAKGGRDVKWFPWGDSPDPNRANYRHQGESFFAGLIRLLGLRRMGTKPVGSYAPNGFGLYDMIGNVREWCENDRDPYPGGPKNDEIYRGYGVRRKGKKAHGKAARGGHWQDSNAVYIRLNERSGILPDTARRDLGFRCVKSFKAQSP
jgi:formylglycine-generating enzyme required for sulfatase activity